MNVALTTSHGRLAPCFPGAALHVVAPNREWSDSSVVSTDGWDPLVWGRELLRRDVSVLLCSGMFPFLWGVLQGYGIRVVPNASGSAADVLQAWRSGDLTVPEAWPCEPGVRCCRGRWGRRRFRGGRGWMQDAGSD